MPNMSKQYQIILGTFIDNEFIWHDVDSFDNLEDAYREFKKYVNSQLKYTDEELVKVWNTGRLDVELRRGNKLLNWVGIYAREVANLDEDEEKEADKEEKERVKDANPRTLRNPYAVRVRDLDSGFAVIERRNWKKYGVNAIAGIWQPSYEAAKADAQNTETMLGIPMVIIDLATQERV